MIRDVMITTGLVDTSSTPKPLKLIESGKLDPTVFATNRFELDHAEEVYEIFAAPWKTRAIKVVLRAAPVSRELLAREEVEVAA